MTASTRAVSLVPRVFLAVLACLFVFFLGGCSPGAAGVSSGASAIQASELICHAPSDGSPPTATLDGAPIDAMVLVGEPHEGKARCWVFAKGLGNIEIHGAAYVLDGATTSALHAQELIGNRDDRVCVFCGGVAGDGRPPVISETLRHEISTGNPVLVSTSTSGNFLRDGTDVFVAGYVRNVVNAERSGLGLASGVVGAIPLETTEHRVARPSLDIKRSDTISSFLGAQ